MNDQELIVERIPKKSYYYKFSFKTRCTRSHKRSVVICGEGELHGVSYSFGYYERPFNDLKYRISQRFLDELIRSAER